LDINKEERFEFIIDEYNTIIYDKDIKIWWLEKESDDDHTTMEIICSDTIDFPEEGFISINEDFTLTLELFEKYKSIINNL